MYNKKQCKEIFYDIILKGKLSLQYQYLESYRDNLDTLFRLFKLYDGETNEESAYYVDRAIKFVQHDYFKNHPFFDMRVLYCFKNGFYMMKYFFDVLEILIDEEKVSKLSLDEYLDCMYELITSYQDKPFEHRKYFNYPALNNLFDQIDLYRDRITSLKEKVTDYSTFFYTTNVIIAYEFLHTNGNYNILDELLNNYDKYCEIVLINGFMRKNNGHTLDDEAFYHYIPYIFGRKNKQIR